MFERIMEKPVRRVVGLMSGTSVDGIDAALVEIKGTIEPLVTQLAFENIPYPRAVREDIFALFDPVTSSVEKIGAMNFLLGELFAEAALSVIRKAGLTPSDVDLIGSHGQTIYHQPSPVHLLGRDICYTFQIGEGAVIANRTGIPCVSDFRVADMAAGGQGAPLVPFTEFLLYRSKTRNILLQNIGGIGNITVIPANCTSNEVFAFDTGPGNMVIDGLVNRLFPGLTMDKGGEIARKGSIHNGLLQTLTHDTYFSIKPPKTTGREHFGSDYVLRILSYMEQNKVSNEDAISTATYLTAWSIKEAYHQFIKERCIANQLIIGGGGSYNQTLVQHIRNELQPFGVETMIQEDTGNSSDAKEAIAFALLAHCTLAGIPNVLPQVTGASKPAVLGKISL